MKKLLTAFALLFFALTTFSQRTLVAPINPDRIFPKWVQGDRDFWGHGPLFTGTVRVDISEGKAQLIAFIDLRLEETEGDKSAAEIKESRLIYSAPAGKQIKAIITPGSKTTSMNVKLTRGGLNRLNAPRGGPVHHFIVNGDGEGNDIGNDTNDDSHVSIFFGGMVVELEPLSTGVKEITVNKSVFAGVLNGQLRGTTGRINTYGPRRGDSWLLTNDSWIKFPDAIRRERMVLTDLTEILFSPWRYNYNDINLQSVTAVAADQYLQIRVNWESDGPELRGECVDDAKCIMGSPSVQLDDLKILINVRPFASGGKLMYDKQDVQVNFTYNFGADCGLLSELCKEMFKDPLQRSLFSSRFRMANILNEDATRNEISNALTNGVLNYIRTIGGSATASQIVDVKDSGNSMVLLYR